MTRHILLYYIRLSSRKKDQDVTPEVQRKAGERLAQENGWLIEFFDEGEGLHSARKRTHLPQWDALLERALSDPQVAAIGSYDLRRSFRETETFLRVCKQLRKAGVQLMFAREGKVNFDDPYAWFLQTIQAGAAELEAFLTSDRLLKANAELRTRGVYLGHHAPFGLKRLGHANDGTLETSAGALVAIGLLPRLWGALAAILPAELEGQTRFSLSSPFQ